MSTTPVLDLAEEIFRILPDSPTPATKRRIYDVLNARIKIVGQLWHVDKDSLARSNDPGKMLDQMSSDAIRALTSRLHAEKCIAMSARDSVECGRKLKTFEFKMYVLKP